MVGLFANSMRPDGTLTVTYQFMGATQRPIAVKRVADDDTKTCPDCAESVKLAARI